MSTIWSFFKKNFQYDVELFYFNQSENITWRQRFISVQRNPLLERKAKYGNYFEDREEVAWSEDDGSSVFLFPKKGTAELYALYATHSNYLVSFRICIIPRFMVPFSTFTSNFQIPSSETAFSHSFLL